MSSKKAVITKSQTAGQDEDSALQKQHAIAATKKYGRGSSIATRKVRDPKLRSNLRALEERNKSATLQAKNAEILLEHDGGFLEPDGPLERTYKVRQEDIKHSVAVETAKKNFDLKLDEALGPYLFDYERNGRGILLAGRKGHIAAIENWRDGTLGCELQLQETIRDVKWLHNSQMFAVAQKKYVHIYGKDGVELHVLRHHIEPLYLEFLPYHFLLASLGNAGFLKYTDTSTGQLVTELPTRLGTPTSFAQNPYNAILHAGHQNGTVTLWSPNSTSPLAKLLTQRGPVKAISIDRSGKYMVTTGQESRMAVWDIRMFKELNSYFVPRPGSSLAISDKKLTAVGWGTQVTIWKGLFDSAIEDQEQTIVKQQSPYMNWGGDGQRVEKLRWCPFEDILGVGHQSGFSSVIVPGAGEPNYDALELNPYETTKQRQETEVRSLLNKLQPEMISLDPNFIGTLDLASHETRVKEKDLDYKSTDIVEKLSKKGRGRNSALRRHLRKKGQKNVIDENRVRLEEAMKNNKLKALNHRRRAEKDLGSSLSRFVRTGG